MPMYILNNANVYFERCLCMILVMNFSAWSYIIVDIITDLDVSFAIVSFGLLLVVIFKSLQGSQRLDSNDKQ